MNPEIVFYTDEQFPLPIVRELRRRGVRVVTTQDAQRLGTPDDSQLHFAAEHGYVLVTQDDDFLRLHAAGYSHTGIVYTRQGTKIGRIVEDLVLIAMATTLDEMASQVIHVPI